MSKSKEDYQFLKSIDKQQKEVRNIEAKQAEQAKIDRLNAESKAMETKSYK